MRRRYEQRLLGGMRVGRKVRMIVATSDWHADAVTAGVPRLKDVQAAVANVLGMVRSYGSNMTAMVFAGDLSNPDSPRAWAAVELMMQVAVELREREVPFLLITGNHDVCEDGGGSHVLQPLRPNATVADEPQTGTWHDSRRGRMIRWLALPFVPACRAYDPQVVVETIAPGEHVDVVVSHLNVEGIGPGSETTDFARGRQVFLPLAAIRRRWPKAQILQGHYHRPHVFEGVTVIGSLERFTVADAGEPRSFVMMR